MDCEYVKCTTNLIIQRKGKRFCSIRCKVLWYKNTEHGKMMLAKHAYNRKLKDAGIDV